MRSDKKRVILLTLAFLFASCALLGGHAAGTSGASYDVYVKTVDGWALQEQLCLSKYYETVSIDLSAVLPDVDGEYTVRIVQHGGITAHIDYVAFSDGTPIAPTSATCIDDGRDILRKVVSLDNDVADAWGKTIECVWADGGSAPVLLFNANQELYTIDAPLLTPFVMTPELMMPYTIQNNGFFAGDSAPDTSEADFSDCWTPTSGHPWGYTYLWLRSDGEYLYAIMEVTSDNTYDETGWARLYVYANGEVKEFRVDAASHEYGVDRFIYTGTVPWQHMVYEFKLPLSEIGAAPGDTLKIGFGSYGTGFIQFAEAETYVWDPETAQWVKELTADIGDTLRFKCTITNPVPNTNLSDIRFWDVLDCSLEFVGNVTLTNASGIEQAVTLPTLPSVQENCFKPHVLHPNDPFWNPMEGDPTGEYFTELCPNVGTQRQIVGWEDYTWSPVVSVDDLVQLSSIPPYPWYHVDRVPITLNLSNATYGTKYFDSVLNWNDLINPVNSTWLEVCGCKEQYTLINVSSGGDKVTMQNDQTLEEVQYLIQEVLAKDLVVSRMYEIDQLLNTTLILEPLQTITIEYDATVVRCGVDNNTFCAKGYACDPQGNCRRVYSNEDKVIIKVPCLSAAKAPLVTPLGLVALIVLLIGIAIGAITRLRKKR